MADRSPARELGQDHGFEHSEREDSLEDSASHIAVAPHLREVPPLTTVVLATNLAPYSDCGRCNRDDVSPAPLVAPAT